MHGPGGVRAVGQRGGQAEHELVAVQQLAPGPNTAIKGRVQCAGALLRCILRCTTAPTQDSPQGVPCAVRVQDALLLLLLVLARWHQLDGHGHGDLRRASAVRRGRQAPSALLDEQPAGQLHGTRALHADAQRTGG